MNKDKKVAEHYDAVANNYHEQYDKDKLFSIAKYPANYFRLQKLITCFANKNVRRVVEIGVGEGTPLSKLAEAGIDVWGIDISQEMVKKSKEKAAGCGLNPDNILCADIQDACSYSALLKKGCFDGLMAMGVMPHINNDEMVLNNMVSLVRPGGSVFIEFRNKLFSLFTFNRNTHDFIIDDLLVSVDDKVKKAASEKLKMMLKMEFPKKRMKVEGDKAGYDAILSKFHNPFLVKELFEKLGFEDIQFHWYHYHPVPPFMEEMMPELFRREAIGLEHEVSGWRGMFLCSAFVVEARKSSHDS